MSVNLCIDWGNTNIKAAVFLDDQVHKVFSFKAEEAKAKITSIIDLFHPVKGVLCSVADHGAEIEFYLKDKIRQFLVLDSRTRLPINNAYATPETLGADRIALVVAAHFLYPDKNNLVIGAGTCITYSLMNKNKTFRGGTISPGLQMRLKAMKEYTDKLPEVKLDGDVMLLGYDTESGMRSGAVYGAAAEIDGMIKQYESQYPDFNAILTGGDAPYLANKIKSKIFADPDILLKGLNLILNYNVPLPR